MPHTRSLQAPRRYEPRVLDTALHRLVRHERQTFCDQAAARGHPLPDFVRETLAAFQECGDPARGFIHIKCSSCDHERIVVFACKRRGVCPSCAGRRMNEVAQHLTDNVLPHVATRQWVLTLPYSLRYRLAYDRELVGPVLSAFIRALFASHRRRVKNRYAIAQHVNLQPGAVTLIQRFGGAINLNVHFHTLVLDGLYAIDHKAGTAACLVLLCSPGRLMRQALTY